MKGIFLFLVCLFSVSLVFSSSSVDPLTKRYADTLYCHSDGTNCENQTVVHINGTESNLTQLGDVSVSSPSDDEVLYYNSTTNTWMSKLLGFLSPLFSSLDFSGTSGFSDLEDNIWEIDGTTIINNSGILSVNSSKLIFNDTNANTLCSGDEVLLGNGSCTSSSGFGSGNGSGSSSSYWYNNSIGLYTNATRVSLSDFVTAYKEYPYLQPDKSTNDCPESFTITYGFQTQRVQLYDPTSLCFLFGTCFNPYVNATLHIPNGITLDAGETHFQVVDSNEDTITWKTNVLRHGKYQAVIELQSAGTSCTYDINYTLGNETNFLTVGNDSTGRWALSVDHDRFNIINTKNITTGLRDVALSIDTDTMLVSAPNGFDLGLVKDGITFNPDPQDLYCSLDFEIGTEAAGGYCNAYNSYIKTPEMLLINVSWDRSVTGLFPEDFILQVGDRRIFDIENNVTSFFNNVTFENNLTFNGNVTFGGTTKNKWGQNELIIAANDTINKENADYILDGVDDNVEIQEAIDLLTEGGTIYLLQGNYYGSEISMRDKTNIIGEGVSTIIQDMSIRIEDVEDVNIISLFLNNSGYTYTFPPPYESETEYRKDGILIDNSQNIKISNNKIALTEYGVRIQYGNTSQNIEISNNLILDSHSAGFFLFNVNRLTLKDNTIVNSIPQTCTSRCTEYAGSSCTNEEFATVGGIGTNSLENSVISNNRIIGGEYGISSFQCGCSDPSNPWEYPTKEAYEESLNNCNINNYTISSTFIDSNSIFNVNKSGIKVIGKNMQIKNNIINNGSNIGILIQDGSVNQISNNDVSNFTIGIWARGNANMITLNTLVDNNFTLDFLNTSNTTILGNYPGGSSMEIETAEGQEIKMKPEGVLTAILTPNLYNFTGDIFIQNTTTSNEYCFNNPFIPCINETNWNSTLSGSGGSSDTTHWYINYTKNVVTDNQSVELTFWV